MQSTGCVAYEEALYQAILDQDLECIKHALALLDRKQVPLKLNYIITALKYTDQTKKSSHHCLFYLLSLYQASEKGIEALFPNEQGCIDLFAHTVKFAPLQFFKIILALSKKRSDKEVGYKSWLLANPENHLTPLHLSSIYAKTEIAILLLQEIKTEPNNRKLVNAVSRVGNTALHFVKPENTILIEELLISGANPAICNKAGKKALNFKKLSSQTLASLVKNGAFIALPNSILMGLPEANLIPNIQNLHLYTKQAREKIVANGRRILHFLPDDKTIFDICYRILQIDVGLTEALAFRLEYDENIPLTKRNELIEELKVRVPRYMQRDFFKPAPIIPLQNLQSLELLNQDVIFLDALKAKINRLMLNLAVEEGSQHESYQTFFKVFIGILASMYCLIYLFILALFIYLTQTAKDEKEKGNYTIAAVFAGLVGFFCALPVAISMTSAALELFINQCEKRQEISADKYSHIFQDLHSIILSIEAFNERANNHTEFTNEKSTHPFINEELLQALKHVKNNLMHPATYTNLREKLIALTSNIEELKNEVNLKSQPLIINEFVSHAEKEEVSDEGENTPLLRVL